MPHYKNGAPAEVQDLVIYTDRYSKTCTLGILVAITPGCETCNASVIPVARKWPASTWLPFSSFSEHIVTLSDCALVGEDLTSRTCAEPQPDGDPRPPAAT